MTCRRYTGVEGLKYIVEHELSPFERDAADLLGEAFGGLYHMDPDELRRGEWSERMVKVGARTDLSTFDFNMLTRLVLLAHERCVRLSIIAASKGRVFIVLHPRSRTGDSVERHPNIEEAIAKHAEHFGPIVSQHRPEFAAKGPVTS